MKVTVFGESMSPGVGVILEGLPAGEEISESDIKDELQREYPGFSEIGATAVEDTPVITSGVYAGVTTGAPLCVLIRTPSQSTPQNNPEIPRPGLPDFAARIRFGGYNDPREGGAFGTRLVTPLIAAGAICRSILLRRSVSVSSKIVGIGAARGTELDNAMRKEILDARASGDSIGGIVECRAVGLRPGLGGLVFDGIEGCIARALFALPSVRGVEFGAGFEIAAMRGSEANDPIRIEDGQIFTETNNAGGALQGLTTGMPLIVRCAVAPTPAISREQKTIDLEKRENVTIRLRGRNSPCLVPMTAVAAEAALCLTLLEAML